MKVLAVNGSPRKKGNTGILLRRVLAVLEQEGMETELVELAGRKIRGCIACYKCFDKQDRRCGGLKDDFNGIFAKMEQAQGILLGSPTYFCNVSTEMKAVIDRAGLVSVANGDLLKRKVGAAVVAVRRAGSIPVFDAINHLFLHAQMIVPGSSYWNLGLGLEPGDVDNDEEGVRTMEVLGANMAWLMKKIA